MMKHIAPRMALWGGIVLLSATTLPGLGQPASASCLPPPPSGTPPAAVSCDSLDEVRANIDRIDRIIVPLLAERATYVAQASKFKSSPSTVVDTSRVERIILRVRAMAEDSGVDPALIERIYRGMIETYTAFEADAWSHAHPAP